MRSVFTADDRPWGSLCLVRAKGEPDFDGRELRLLRWIAPHLGAGIKAASLRQQATQDPDDASGVLILDHDNRVVQHTPAAVERVAELGGPRSLGSQAWRDGDDLPLAVWSATMALRRSLAPQSDGDLATVPQVRVLGRAVRWLAIQASLTEPGPGHPSRTVVVISPAGPREVVRLRKSAYGLSPREEEIADLVVRGLSTKEISRSLFISEYTVQDHLKNVFGKTGVKSRRELVKRLFLDSLPPGMSA